MDAAFYKTSVSDIINRKGNQLFILPHKLLQPYIAHYTITVRGSDLVPDTLTLIPDASGCMVFTFDNNSLEGLFWGASTKTAVIKNDINDVPMRIFIEFLPGGAYQLTGCHQAELKDICISSEDFNKQLSQRIKNAFEAALNLQDLVDRLNNLFLLRLVNIDVPDTATAIISYIQKYNGLLSVREISNMTLYSERHLNRIFSSALGLSAKTYSRLLRINYVLQRMKQGNKTLIELSYEAGYFDQSHFIHDFKSVCGVTPTAYLQNLSDFYNEDYKFHVII